MYFNGISTQQGYGLVFACHTNSNSDGLGCFQQQFLKAFWWYNHVQYSCPPSFLPHFCEFFIFFSVKPSCLCPQGRPLPGTWRWLPRKRGCWAWIVPRNWTWCRPQSGYSPWHHQVNHGTVTEVFRYCHGNLGLMGISIFINGLMKLGKRRLIWKND